MRPVHNRLYWLVGINRLFRVKRVLGISWPIWINRLTRREVELSCDFVISKVPGLKEALQAAFYDSTVRLIAIHESLDFVFACVNVQVVGDQVSELVHFETKIPIPVVMLEILRPDEPSEDFVHTAVWPGMYIVVATVVG